MANPGKPKLVLANLDGSPPASVVKMIADILGLDLELTHPDFFNYEHKSKDYRKKNPMGTVPTLIDGDFVISDSAATAKYLLAKYGGDLYEKLYPSDIKTSALVDQCLFFNAGVLFIRLREVTATAREHSLKAPTEKNISGIEDAYSVLEAYLTDHKYLACDRLTLADIAVGSTTNALQGIHKLDQTKFPRTYKWFETLKEEQFFNKIDVPSAVKLGSRLENFWKKNNAQEYEMLSSLSYMKSTYI